MKTNSLFIVLMFCTIVSLAQVLDADTCIAIKISNTNNVTVCKQRSSFDVHSNEYYYLPTQLRLSRNKKKKLEFSFLEYQEENQTSGAILHFLITWGLTKEQLKEVQEQLTVIKGEKARLMGAVMPKALNPKVGFIITGRSNIATILNKSITSIGKTSVFPNSKIAASFRFNGSDAKTVKKAITENNTSLKNIFIHIDYELKFSSQKLYQRTYKLKTNFHELLNIKL